MKELFLPYYVNSGRLLDIYSILNHGYSEYEELALSSNLMNKSGVKGEGIITAGFKLLNLGVNLSGSKEKATDTGTYITEKKIQTIPSTLKIVKDEMKEDFKELKDAEIGDFVELESVTFQINSIKYLMDEFESLMKLGSLITSTGDSKNPGGRSSKNNDMKQFNDISKLMRTLGDGEEVLYQNNDFAIFGNIYDEHLYQATKLDIINSPLNCLCQIKRKYENGTSLMKNTILTKIKDKDKSNQFLNLIASNIVENDFYDVDSVVVSEIRDKPVYEIEIIALYK